MYNEKTAKTATASGMPKKVKISLLNFCQLYVDNNNGQGILIKRASQAKRSFDSEELVEAHEDLTAKVKAILTKSELELTNRDLQTFVVSYQAFQSAWISETKKKYFIVLTEEEALLD